MLQNQALKDTHGSTATNPGVFVLTVNHVLKLPVDLFIDTADYFMENSSDGVPKLPSFTLKLATSKSFVVKNPVFVIYGTQVIWFLEL